MLIVVRRPAGIMKRSGIHIPLYLPLIPSMDSRKKEKSYWEMNREQLL